MTVSFGIQKQTGIRRRSSKSGSIRHYCRLGFNGKPVVWTGSCPSHSELRNVSIYTAVSIPPIPRYVSTGQLRVP